MWEVPLNVRYDFNPDNKNRWFVSAGLSSYFIKDESYDCMYYYPSTGQSYLHTWPYNKGSNHLLSNLQLSGGYIHKIGNVNLRIEPYFKIPIKGVGIGSMPLQSTGIHVGITKELF
jgi:hypothetical protein